MELPRRKRYVHFRKYVLNFNISIMMTRSICYLSIHENENSTTLPTDCAAIGYQLAELVQALSLTEDCLLLQVAGCE